MQTLVLGLGNLLLGDEGVGVHVARHLAERIKAQAVCISDAGTALLDVLPQLEIADRVIVVDACKGNSRPGTVYCLDLDECEEKKIIGSVHGFDLKCVLAMTNRITVPSVTVIGIEPEMIGWSMDLSPAVAAVVPRVIEIVENMITSEQLL
jgi:hydrogenase maturation protease